MERADNTTKLPQKQSKETRLTIGNVKFNLQAISGSNSNTVNNNSRNVKI